MRKKRKNEVRERESKQRDAKKEEKRGQFVNFWYRSTPQS